MAGLDAAFLFVAYWLANFVSRNANHSLSEALWAHWPYFFAVYVVWILQAVDQRLFVSRRGDPLLPQLFVFTKTIVLTLVLAVFILALWTQAGLNRPFLWAFILFALMVMVPYRSSLRLGLWGLRRRGYGYRRILLVGANPRSRNIAQIIVAQRHYGYQIIGCLDDDPARARFFAKYDVPYLGPIDKLEEQLVGNVVDVVYIALPVRSCYEQIQSIAHLCEGIGVPVRLLADLFPLRMARSHLEKLGPHPLLTLSPEQRTEGLMLVRRLTDLTVSTLLMVILAPFLLVIALLIRLESRGPVLIRKERISGRSGERFNLFKFRTHVWGNGETKLTRLGGRLKRYGLDQLPGLINVWLGQISLVEPRPYYPPEQDTAGAHVTPFDAHDVVPAPAPDKSGMAARLVQLTLEWACLLGAYTIACNYAFMQGMSLEEKMLVNAPYLAIVALLWVGTLLERPTWSRDKLSDSVETQGAQVLKSVADSLVLVTAVMALFTSRDIDRDFMLAFGVSALMLVLLLRLLLQVGATMIFRQGVLRQRVLVVGANERSAALMKALERRAGDGFEVVGSIDEAPVRSDYFQATAGPMLGGLNDLARVVEDHAIDRVYVALPIRSFYGAIQDIAEFCEARRIPMLLMADLFPTRIATNRVLYVEDVPLISLSAVPEEQFRLALKRAVDFTVSSALLFVLFPLMFLPLAILIKLETPGPVFFSQVRVGQNQRRFKMLKFRSMVADAEIKQQELAAMNEADGPVFKIRNDPRVTHVGRFIRKYSIDEFPQLINVWLGQMSLVGPRPPIPAEVEKYSWDQRRRLSVKPGMTGLWQVSGRSDVAFEQWVQLDLEYIDTWSLFKDFSILVRTFRAVVEGRGAA